MGEKSGYLERTMVGFGQGALGVFGVKHMPMSIKESIIVSFCRHGYFSLPAIFFYSNSQYNFSQMTALDILHLEC